MGTKKSQVGSVLTAEDSEARELAAEAKSQLLAHERLCTERWEQSRRIMTEMHDDVKALLVAHARQAGALTLGKTALPMLWAVFAAVISGLAWLAVHYAPRQ